MGHLFSFGFQKLFSSLYGKIKTTQDKHFGKDVLITDWMLSKTGKTVVGTGEAWQVQLRSIMLHSSKGILRSHKSKPVYVLPSKMLGRWYSVKEKNNNLPTNVLHVIIFMLKLHVCLYAICNCMHSPRKILQYTTLVKWSYLRHSESWGRCFCAFSIIQIKMHENSSCTVFC